MSWASVRESFRRSNRVGVETKRASETEKSDDRWEKIVVSSQSWMTRVATAARRMTPAT